MQSYNTSHKNILSFLFYKKYHVLFKALIIIVATLTNMWWFPIFKENFLYGLLVIIITLFLFILTFKLSINKTIFNFSIVALAISLFSLSIILINNQFDITLKTANPTEVMREAQRHGLFADGLGILFTNKISQNFYKNFSLPLEKYLRNISYSVDLNLYFFKSHPREKSGIDEIDKYSIIFLPFFVIGLLRHFLYPSKYKILTLYLSFSIVVNGFLSPYFKPGPILFFPYVSNIIALGGLIILKKTHGEKTT